MAIYFDVFSSLMKHRVVGYVYSVLVITIYVLVIVVWTSKSWISWASQLSLLVVLARAWYSASMEKQETTVYFLSLHDIGELSRNMYKLVTKLLVLGQNSQSKFEKAFNWRLELFENKIPYPMVPFKYLKLVYAEARYGVQGWATNWLSLWNMNVMSSIMMVRYSRRLIRCLYYAWFWVVLLHYCLARC